MGPSEAGGFSCRYHPAVLPLFRPRIWTLNSGKDRAGRVWYDEWFGKQHHVDAIAAVSKGDEAWISDGSVNEQAVARRSFVVHVVNSIFEAPKPGEPKDDSFSTYFATGLKRALLERDI